MFSDHKQQILKHETEYGVQIGNATYEYGRAVGLTIKTLEQSFDLVYTHIREMKALNMAMLLHKQMDNAPTLKPLSRESARQNSMRLAAGA